MGCLFVVDPQQMVGVPFGFPKKRKLVPLKNKEDNLQLVSGQITTEKSEAGIGG